MSVLQLWPAIPALFIAWMLHTLDVNRLEDDKDKALAEQANTLSLQCLADKQKTQELADALQKNNDAINDKLAALKLRKPSACVRVSPAATPAKHDAGAQPAKPTGQADGVAVDSLLDIGAEGDKWGAQLDICQRFIREVWKANAQ